MFNFWKRLTRKPSLPADGKPHNGRNMALRCTYCEGEEFYEGPQGGLSTNILCANRDCRHWFNHTVLGFGSHHILDDLNHVEKLEMFPKETA